MSTSARHFAVLRFDEFELNIQSGELRKHGKVLRLQPQPANVVALSPPAILVLQHGHGHTGEVPAPCSFYPHVIAVAVQVLPVSDSRVPIFLPLIGPAMIRRCLTVLRVEI